MTHDHVSSRRLMIRRSTTFILGAGASRSYGFPTAYGLYDRVCSGQSQTPPIARDDPVLQELAEGLFGDFRRELRQSGQQSVDAFLEHRADLLDVGKRAIACGLIPFESEKALFTSEHGLRWYEHLFAAMNSRLPEFRQNAVQVLTFNYDRSLEHFLTTSLAATHNISLPKAWEQIQHIPIVHLYGALGAHSPGGQVGRPYDTSITALAVQHCVDSLKIVHENVSDDKEFIRAYSILGETQRVVFLGFAFHRANVDRLRLHTVSSNVEFYASSFGMTHLERQQAQRMVGRGIDLSP